MRTLFAFLLLAGTVSFFTSCEKDDPEIPHEEELITTLNYTLTDPNGETVTLTFQDIDGDGGNSPTITNGTLSSNTTYSGSIELLNESEDPIEDLTSEIREEANDHQFFFTSSAGNITVAYDDTDDNGNPVGLETTLTTSDAGSGSLTVILRHEPEKSNYDVNTNDYSNVGGETDIEVVFPINVQ